MYLFYEVKPPSGQFPVNPSGLSEKRVAGAHKRRPLFQVSSGAAPFPAVMYTSPNHDPMSIFVDRKLKSGTYKVQNLASKTYLEVLEHSKELCCRPAAVLAPKDALVI